MKQGGRAQGTRGPVLVALATELAHAGGWAAIPAEVMVRRTAVAEAKHQAQRDAVAELASLRTHLSALPECIRTILLIDDVLASGDTLAACVGALRRDGWRGAAAAIVVARAESPTARVCG